jgi:uncharacterized protein (UPF0333 family)
MRHKKGQAAMEFLMTYGWAILVVLVVIGALAYFGVLNPQQFLPKKCQFAAGFVCVDHIITQDADEGNILVLSNTIGDDIRITTLNFTADNGRVSLANTSSVANYPGIIVPAGTDVRIYLATGWSELSSGTRIKGNLWLNYTNLKTTFPHIVRGTMLTDIES